MTNENLESYSNNGEFNAFAQTPFSKGVKTIKLLFIGNSITIHAPSPNIGWNRYCGMAAPNEQSDYVHILLDKLNISESEMIVINCAEFERIHILDSESLKNIQHIIASNTNIYTVIQLGDNIINEAQLSIFFNNMNYFLKEIGTDKSQTFMISTWWNSEAKNQIIRNLCEIHNTSYVNISDLHASPINPEVSIIEYENFSVNNHPKLWGMEQIANRIYIAITDIKNT